MQNRPILTSRNRAGPRGDLPRTPLNRYQRLPRMEVVSAAQRPASLIPTVSPLTARQLECLAWISEGKSSTDIGAILGISPRTVDYHVAEICQRLGVRTRMQAVKQAVRLRWIDG